VEDNIKVFVLQVWLFFKWFSGKRWVRREGSAKESHWKWHGGAAS
jgi:hypothetical protein